MNDKKNKASEKDRDRTHAPRRVPAQWNKFAATLGTIGCYGQYSKLDSIEETKKN